MGRSPGTAADALVGSFRADDEPDQGSPTRASFCQRPGQGPGADEGVRPTWTYASIYWDGRLAPVRHSQNVNFSAICISRGAAAFTT